jgi:hypothetical protein
MACSVIICINCAHASGKSWVPVKFDIDGLISEKITLGRNEFRIVQVSFTSESSHSTQNYYIQEKTDYAGWQRVYTDDDARDSLSSHSSAGDCAGEEVSFFVHENSLFGIKMIRSSPINASAPTGDVEIRVFRLDALPPPTNVSNWFFTKILTKSYPLDHYCGDVSPLINQTLKKLP